MTAHAHTGRNSYLVCCRGEYLYDLESKLTGSNPALAIAFLWTPEELADRLAAMERRMSWVGSLSAVRARQ